MAVNAAWHMWPSADILAIWPSGSMAYLAIWPSSGDLARARRIKGLSCHCPAVAATYLAMQTSTHLSVAAHALLQTATLPLDATPTLTPVLLPAGIIAVPAFRCCRPSVVGGQPGRTGSGHGHHGQRRWPHTGAKLLQVSSRVSICAHDQSHCQCDSRLRHYRCKLLEKTAWSAVS